MTILQFPLAAGSVGEWLAADDIAPIAALSSDCGSALGSNPGSGYCGDIELLLDLKSPH